MFDIESMSPHSIMDLYNRELYLEEKVFDKRLQELEFLTIDDFVDMYESPCKISVFEEKKSIPKPLTSRLKIFFSNLISEVKRFLKELQVKAGETFRGAQYAKMIHKISEEIDDAKAQGKTKVEMNDFESLYKEYKYMHDDLSKYAKKFVKMEYKYTTDVANDLYKFEELAEKYEDKLDKLQDKTIVIPIDKAKEFVDKEITGRTEILLSINTLIADIEMMQFVAEETANRKDFLGSDVLKDHVGAIRRVALKFTKFTKKFTVKCIVWNVLRFAD